MKRGPPGCQSPEMIRTLLLGLLLVGSTTALDSAYLPNKNYGTDEAAAQEFASDFNSTAEQVFFMSVEASWSYNTNLTEYNAAQQVRGARHYAQHCHPCQHALLIPEDMRHLWSSAGTLASRSVAPELGSHMLGC